MKRTLKRSALAALLALGSTQAFGESDVSMTYNTQYIGRNGLPQSTGKALHLDANQSIKNLNVGAWANYGIPERDVTELNLYGSWNRDIGNRLSLGLGTTHYNYPSGLAPWTQEVFANLGFSGPVNGSILGVYDFVDGDGGMAVVSLDRPFMIRGIEITPFVSVAGNFEYFSDDNGGTHGTLGSDFKVPLSEELTLEGKLNLQKDLKSEYGDRVYGGMTLRWTP